MAFAPFDGVLLDDPREPIPGAVAIALHRRVERSLASKDRRPPLKAQALRDRAAACQALLGQGLLPGQMKALERHGLPLGSPRDARSLASLVRHLEAYLGAVEAQGYLEPSAALWRAAEIRASGQRGFWVERQPEDGPLAADLRDLAPPRLRALCLLPELSSVRFRVATRRGAGRSGLFESREPHLVRQLLPALEDVAVERGLEHLELEAPEGWGENPWGAALDGLFEGPLELDPQAAACLRRALLPTEAAVWRAAVEQVRAWVDQGLPPASITLVHPDPAAVAPLLGPLLAAEGIPLQGCPGRSLAGAPAWGPLAALLAGLRDLDPSALAAGLGASSRRSLRVLASRLARVDQAGEAALHRAVDALPDGDRAWAKDRWAFLWSLRGRNQPPAAWLKDLEALVQRLELLPEKGAFYPALGLLEEAWAGDGAAMAFPDMLEALEDALEVMRAPGTAAEPGGAKLLAPASLESGWEGCRAALLLDLGEGAWPPAPAAEPELDWDRRAAVNRALRAQSSAGEGPTDFPPRLQAFILPRAEEGEMLPRAFHREAHRFNRVLALASDHVVALSAERDAEGQRRAQGLFWRALDGAGAWAPDESQAASRLRWRWEAAEPDALLRARQASVRAGAPGLDAERRAPERDWTPGVWDRGDSAEAPLAPTLLEGLARCPFRVRAGRVQKLETWEESDGHVLHLGTLAHRLVEALLSGLEGASHWPLAFLERHGLAAPSAAGVQGLLQACWRDRGEDWLAELAPPAAPGRLRLAVEDLLPAMAAVLAEDLEQEAPAKEELTFLDVSPETSWRRELAGLELALEPRAVALPGGAEVWVHGTVDRLEQWVSGDFRFLRIVDYKTSRYAALKAYRDDAAGAHLQLPLYQVLLERERGLPVTALLVSLKEPWRPVPMMLKGEDQARLLESAAALLARARRGDFPAIPGEHCAGCVLAVLCGRPVDIDGGEEAEP